MSDGFTVPIYVTLEGAAAFAQLDQAAAKARTATLQMARNADLASQMYTKLGANARAAVGSLTAIGEKTAEFGSAIRKLNSEAYYLTKMQQQFARLNKEVNQFSHDIALANAGMRVKMATDMAQVDLYERTGKTLARLSAEVKHKSSADRVQIAVLSAQNKLLDQHAALMARSHGEVRNLQSAVDALNSRFIASDAIQKERIKGAVQLATFQQRQANQLGELIRLENDWATGTAKAAAQTKERIKGMEQLGTAATRLANEEARLADIQRNHAFQVQKIAIMKEEIKGSEALAVQTIKLANEEALLLAGKSGLARAAHERVIILREEQKNADALALTDTKLAGANDLLRASLTGLTGAMASENALLKVQRKNLDDAATFTERMRGKSQELASTLDYLRTPQGRLDTQNEHAIRVQKALTLVRDEYMAKTKLLQASLTEVTDTERRQQAALSAKERLLKRNAELTALNSTELKKLALENKRLEASLRKAGAAMGEFNLHTSIGNQLTASLRSSLAALSVSFGMYTSSTILAALATYTLLRSMKEAVVVGAKFEDEMARVGAIGSRFKFGTEGYAQDLAALKQRAIEIAATTRYTATEVTAAMSELALSGLNVEETIKAVPATLNLAAIGALDFGTAADIATNIMMGFGKEAEDLGGIVDTMAIAVTQSNQNVQQLGNAMSYAAPVATSFGVSLEFVTATTMVLANAGIKASRAGTTLRRMLTGVLAPTTRGQKAFAKLGIQVDALGDSFEGLESLETPIAGLFEGAETGTDALIKRLKELYLATNGAKTNIKELVDVVGLWAAPGTIQVLMSMNKGLNQGLLEQHGLLKRTAGAAEDMRLKIQDSLKGAWDYLRGAVEAVQIQAFTQVGAEIRDVVERLVLMAQGVADNEALIKSFIKALKSFGSTLLEVIKLILWFKAAMIGWAVLKNVGIMIAGLATGMVALGAATLKTGGTIAYMIALLKNLRAVAVLSLGALLPVAGPWILATLAVAGLATAIAVVGDKFLGVSKTVKDVSAAMKGLAENNRLIEEEYDKRFDSLVNGELQALYEKRKEQEDELRRLAEANQLTNTQVDNYKKQETALDSINKKIAEQEQFIRKYSDLRLVNRQADIRLDQAFARDEIKTVEARRSSVQEEYAAPMRGGNRNADRDARLLKELQEADREIARLNAIINYKTLSGKSLEAMQKMLRGTSEDIKAALSIIDDTLVPNRAALENLLKEIETSQSAYKDVMAVLIERKPLGTEDPTIGLLSGFIERDEEAIVALREQVNQLTNDIERLQAAAALYRVSSPVNPQEALDQLEQKTTMLRELEEQSKKTENRILEDAAKSTGERAKKLRADVDSATASITRLATTAAHLDRSIKANDDWYEKNMAGIAELTGAQSGALSDLVAITEEATEAQKKYRDAIDEIRAKYDPVYAMTLQWSEATEDLHMVLRDTRDLGLHNKHLTVAIKGIVEFNDVTGQLTDESQRAIDIMIERTEATLKLTEETLAATEALLELKIVSGADIPGYLFDSLSSMDVVLADVREQLKVLRLARSMTKDASDPNDRKKSDATRDEEAALRALMSTLSEYEKLLQAVGATSAALAVARYKEIMEAEEQERGIIRLRHAFEDLQAARELASRNRSLSDALFKDVVESENAVERMQAMSAAGTLSDLFSGFQSEPIISDIDAIMAKSGETLGDLFGDLGTYADTVGEKISAAFVSIQTHAADAISQIQSAVLQLQAIPGTLGAPGTAPGAASAVSTGQLPGVDTRLVSRINDMVSAAKLEGITLTPGSGYRSVAEQQRIWDANQALPPSQRKSVARPGSSQHNFGRAVDVGATAQGMAWMQNNAEKYNLWAFKGKNYTSHIHLEMLEFRKAAKSLIPVATKAASAIGQIADEGSKLAGLDLSTTIAINPIKDEEAVDTALRAIEAQTAKIKSFEDTNAKIGKLQGKGGFNDADMQRSEEFLKAQQEARQTLLLQIKGFDELMLDSLEKTGQYGKDRALGEAELEALEDQFGTTSAALREYAQQQLMLERLLANNAISQDKFNQAMEDAALAVIATEGPLEAYWASLKGGMQSFEEVSVDSLEHFRTTLIDSLVEGKFEASAFFDFFKRKLAEIAVKTIMVNFVGNIAGIVGNAALGAAGSFFGGKSGGTTPRGDVTTSTTEAVGGGTSGTGGFSGLTNWFGGNSMGVAAGQGLASFATKQGWMNANWAAASGGMAAMPNWAAGVGGIGGSLLGTTLFKNKGLSGIGSSIGSAGGTMGGAALAGILGASVPVLGIIGGLLGGLAGGGIGSLFGGGKKKTPAINMDVSGGTLRSTWAQSWEDMESTNKALEAANELLSGYAKQLGTAATEQLKASNYTSTMLRPDDVEGYLADRIGELVRDMVKATANERIAEQVVNKGLYSEVIGQAMEAAGSDPDALVASLAAARELFDTIRSASANVFTPATDAFIKDSEHAADVLWDLMNATKLAGETMMDSLSRVVNSLQITNDAFFMMNTNAAALDPTERVAAGQKIIDAGGGYEKLMPAMTSYYENFYTPTERNARALTTANSQVSSTFSELGMAVPTTRAAFRQIVEGLDPLTDAGAKTFAALMNVSEAMDYVFDAASKDWEGVSESLTSTIKGLKDSLQSDDEIISNYLSLLEKAQGGDGLAAQELSTEVGRYLTALKTGMDEDLEKLKETLGKNTEQAKIRSRTEADYLRVSRAAEAQIKQAEEDAKVLYEAEVGRQIQQLEAVQSLAQIMEGTVLADNTANQLQSAAVTIASDAAAAANGYYNAAAVYSANQVSAIQGVSASVTQALGNVGATMNSVMGRSNSSWDGRGSNDAFYGGGFATGGIASGPKSGYSALLHGTEAVIPLENGSIPVTLTGGALTDPYRAMPGGLAGTALTDPYQAMPEVAMRMEAPATPYVIGMSFDEMITELKGLRSEVANLRGDTGKQYRSSNREERESTNLLRRIEYTGAQQ